MDKKLLSVLACPVCHGTLVYDKEQARLICKADKLAFPIVGQVPRMLLDEATHLNIEEIKKYG